MSALTSIRPPYTGEIFIGIKGVEWRTKPLPSGKHYCYETKNGGGSGKVIGEFIVFSVKRYGSINDIPELVIKSGRVSREFLKEYSKGRPLFANVIVKPTRYTEPKELSEFCKYGFSNDVPLKRPPQSWCYVKEREGK